MWTKIIIYLGLHHMAAGIWRAGRLSQQWQGANDLAGLKDFLNRYPRAAIAILLDAVDEEYRLESIPHTSGRTQQSLLQRKLAQLYKAPTYFAAQLLTPTVASHDGSKPDIVLCMGFTPNSLFNSCFAYLKQKNYNITGIYLLATLQARLVQQLKLTAVHMLLCWAYPTGVRLSYMQNGQLLFSRWLTAAESSMQTDTWWQQEIDKTRAYLLAQKWITRGDKLELYGHACNSSEIQNIDLSPWAKTLAISQEQLHHAPQWLYMHLLSQHKKAINFAPVSLKLGQQLSHYQYGLYALSSLLLSVSTGLSYAWYQDGQNIQRSLSQTQQKTVQLQHAQASLGKSPMAAQDLMLAVQFKHYMDSRSPSPMLSMQVLSQALEQYPQIELQSLDWQQSTQNTAELADNLAHNIEPSGSSNTCLETSIVSAEINNTGVKNQQIIAQFLQQLQQHPRFLAVTLLPSINLVQPPIKGSSNELQSLLQQHKSQKFSFKLVLRAH